MRLHPPKRFPPMRYLRLLIRRQLGHRLTEFRQNEIRRRAALPARRSSPPRAWRCADHRSLTHSEQTSRRARLPAHPRTDRNRRPAKASPTRERKPPPSFVRCPRKFARLRQCPATRARPRVTRPRTTNRRARAIRAVSRHYSSQKAASPLLQNALLKRDQLPYRRQPSIKHGVEPTAVEQLVLRRPLNLDELILCRRDDVHVDFGG